LIDPVAHQSYTGKSNEIILRNLEVVKKSGVPVVIRIPVISNVNDSDEEIRGFAELAAGIDKIEKVHLLPYHKFGMAKYKILDREYEYADLEAPSEERLQRLKEIVESYKIDCEIRT
jgi:pyruvate formate lyase activating enzyme